MPALTLRDALLRLAVDDLKTLTRLLPDFKLATRKGDLVDYLHTRLLGDDLMRLWACLDDTQKSAVAEATHDPAGKYLPIRFQAKYGAAPLFEVASGAQYSHSFDAQKTRLCLLLYYLGPEDVYALPSDLQTRLLEFVPPPPPLALASVAVLAESEGLTVRLTEREALLELGVMLRTLEHERIGVSEKTGLPSTAALRLLSSKLPMGDFYPWVEKQDKWDQQVGPIKAFAWPMLLQAGGLAVRHGPRLVLSPAGVKALTAPPADILRMLWQKWLKTTVLDEFSRIDTIKGQTGNGRVMTAVAPRRRVIEQSLQQCPAPGWVEVAGLSRFMQASDMHFEVTHDPWQLYISERQYGTLGYSGSHDWSILQSRYISALLFEYAATLGMIDIAYLDPRQFVKDKDFRNLWGADDFLYLSPYDGLSHFRLNALGAYVLGRTGSYQPQAVANDAVLQVMPSLSVTVVRGSLAADATLLLDTWAQAIQPGSWLLDRQKALVAIEKGHAIADLRRFLQSHDDMPLPETVEAFINRCERDATALKLGASAVLVECRDAATAQLIAGHKETHALCLQAGPQTLVVRADKLEKFRAGVHVLGLGLVL